MYLKDVLFLLCIGFIFLPVTSVEAGSTVEVNTDRIVIQKFDDYWEVRLLCSSHVGACYFEFVLIPEGWSVIGQKIRIPIADVMKIKSYLIEVTIREPTGDYVQKEIVLHADHGNFDIEARDKPIYAPPSGAEEKSESEQIQSAFRPKDESQLSWLELNGIIPYVPTLGRLDSIIESGNVLEIVRTIQNIVSDKSECEVKADYLAQIAQSIDKHINQKQQQLSLEENTLKNTQEQLDRLNAQKEQLQEQLKLNEEVGAEQEELKLREIELKRQVRQNLSKHHTYTIVAERYLDMFTTYIDNSAVDPKKIEQIQGQIEEDEEEIQDLNRQIEEIMEKKNLLETRVKDNKKKVRDTLTLGDVTPERLNSLQNNYKKYSNQALEFKRQANLLQQELEAVTKGLTQTEEDTEMIKEQLEEIKKQIEEVMEVDEGDIADLSVIVETLERNAPYIHDEIEQCSNTQQEEEKTPTIVYPTRGINQPDDLLNVNIPPESEFSPYFPILTEFSIFTGDYIVNFGSPKLENFSCQNSSFTGYGIVTDIEEEMFRVRTPDNQIYGLVLGSCTEFKARRPSYIPSIGDIISWQGEQISPVVVNAHTVRMFEF